jgi:hypothetical protein
MPTFDDSPGWASGQQAESDIDRYRKSQQETEALARSRQTEAMATAGPQAQYNAQDAATQNQATGLAQQAAMGNAPSQAQIQMQQGNDQAIKSQMAMAASARGGARGQAAAQMGAQQQGAQMQQANVGNMANLRAQEMAQARSQFSNAAAQQRQQGAQEQQFQTQSELQQRGMNVQREGNWIGAEGQARGQNMGAETAARQGQTDAYMKQQEIRQKQQQAKTEQETDIFGSVLSAAGGLAMMSDIRAKEQISGPDEVRALAASDPKRAWETSPEGARAIEESRKVNSGYYDAGRVESRRMANQELEDETVKARLAEQAKENERQQLRRQGLPTGDERDVSEADYAAAARAPGRAEAKEQERAERDAAHDRNDERMGRWKDTMRGAQLDEENPRDKAAQQRAGRAQVMSSLRMMSDERSKSGRGEKELDGLLSALSSSASTYKYKRPEDEPTSEPTGGRYAGVMAQSLEKAPGVGKQIVKDTPKGKQLEGGALLSALAAGVGRQQQEIDDLKRRAGHGR